MTKLFLLFILIVSFTLPAFGQNYREVDLRVSKFSSNIIMLAF